MEKISYAKTVYGQEEIDAVVQCLNESTQMGNYSRKFESEIAKLFDKKACLYVNSGSSALYIGIESLGFDKGSEVITPALTFGTTVGCLIKNNLIPVFVDVEPLTYCIDHNKIEEMITDKTVAILAPNLMGNICKWDIINLCNIIPNCSNCKKSAKFTKNNIYYCRQHTKNSNYKIPNNNSKNLTKQNLNTLREFANENDVSFNKNVKKTELLNLINFEDSIYPDGDEKV